MSGVVASCKNCAFGTAQFCVNPNECLPYGLTGWKQRADAPATRQEPAGAPSAGAAIPAQQDEGAKPARRHSHYFKDVSHFETVDVYRVLRLFDVTDPCIQHAAKKLLCAGQRGAKDQAKDVQEAIDTLTRWQEMRAEDEGRN